MCSKSRCLADGGGFHISIDMGQILAKVLGEHLDQLGRLRVTGGLVGPSGA